MYVSQGVEEEERGCCKRNSGPGSRAERLLRIFQGPVTSSTLGQLPVSHASVAEYRYDHLTSAVLATAGARGDSSSTRSSLATYWPNESSTVWFAFSRARGRWSSESNPEDSDRHCLPVMPNASLRSAAVWPFQIVRIVAIRMTSRLMILHLETEVF
jgi:hypothetical protein